MEDIYVVRFTDSDNRRHYHTSGRSGTIACYSSVSSAKAQRTRLINSGFYTDVQVLRVVETEVVPV